MNAIPENLKWCPRCDRVLSLEHFGHRSDRPGLLFGRCRECRNRMRRKAAIKPSYGPAPYWTPVTDFLPMGEADRSAVLRWDVGVAV